MRYQKLVFGTGMIVHFIQSFMSHKDCHQNGNVWVIFENSFGFSSSLGSSLGPATLGCAFGSDSKPKPWFDKLKGPYLLGNKQWRAVDVRKHCE